MRKSRQYRGGYQSSRLAPFARDQRRSSTAAELVLWDALRNRKLGAKFRRQHQIGDYVVDFYCSEARLVIECRGFVHASNEAWQHDRARDGYMISLGIRVLRFRNDQVLNEMALVLETIRKCVAEGGRKN